jgi:hypothetical protein
LQREYFAQGRPGFNSFWLGLDVLAFGYLYDALKTLESNKLYFVRFAA